jgi:hypothetical protein
MLNGLVTTTTIIGTTALFEPWSSFKDSAKFVLDHLDFATVILLQSKFMSLASILVTILYKYTEVSVIVAPTHIYVNR